MYPLSALVKGIQCVQNAQSVPSESTWLKIIAAQIIEMQIAVIARLARLENTSYHCALEVLTRPADGVRHALQGFT